MVRERGDGEGERIERGSGERERERRNIYCATSH